MEGPALLNKHCTCVSGQTCELTDVQGIGVRDGDLFFVLDTCGTEVDTSGYDHFGLSYDAAVHVPRIPSNGRTIRSDYDQIINLPLERNPAEYTHDDEDGRPGEKGVSIPGLTNVIIGFYGTTKRCRTLGIHWRNWSVDAKGCRRPPPLTAQILCGEASR